MPIRITLVLLLLVPVTARAGGPTVEELRREILGRYQKAAKELPFLATYDLLWNREITVGMPRGAAEYEEQLKTLRLAPGSPYTAEVLLPLLEHEDPKVRTLALAGLFALEDPLLLPHVARFVHDPAPTFPEPFEVVSYETEWPRYAEPTLKPQTVGAVAQRMIRFYADRSRERIDFRPEWWEGSWAGYWKQRKARGSCAGWLEVKRDRAYGGVTPFREGRTSALERLFYEIREELPPVEQELTLLLLFQADFSKAVPELELLRAARRLGPDRLMAVMEGKPPTDDPDLRPVPGDPGHYTPVRAFILRHAGELLRPSDAERLRTMEKDCWIEELYPIARAALLPEQAGVILHGAFDSFDGEHDQDERAAVVRAIAETSGAREVEFLVEWFYTEPDDPSCHPPHRDRLIELLTRRWSEDDRRILAAIVKDPRFLAIDELMLRHLGEQLDSNLLARLFGFREFHDHVEPEKLPEALAERRRRIRESLPEWEPAGK